MPKNQISQEIRDLCFGYIRNNYQHYISFPVQLTFIIISYFLFQQEISVENLIFATKAISLLKPIGSFYFTSILTAFIIDQPSDSLSTEIFLTEDIKIIIYLASITYKLNKSKKYNKIETIATKLWKFNPSKYVYFIVLNRKTSCPCPDTHGVIKIYIAPYNQHIINNNNESYWKQIQKLTPDNALIKIDLDKYINWRQKLEIKIISNNSNSIKIYPNKSDAFFVLGRNSERRICCQTALEQFK